MRVNCCDAVGRKKQVNRAKGQWFMMLIYLLAGAACGLIFMEYADQVEETGSLWKDGLLPFIYLIILMYAALLIQLVLHEAGHLVFGLLTGYRFSSFRIFGLMWMKEDGRIRLKHMTIAGTGGQCLMVPPDLQDGKMPVLLYNFGGAVMNCAAAVLAFGAAVLCPAPSLFRMFLSFIAVMGFAFALGNGVPLRMGAVSNDGRNAIDLLHNQEAVRGFWIQMKAIELISKGIRLKDMPDEWFVLPSDQAMRNGISAAVGVLACNRLMDEHRFGEADALMERLLTTETGIAGLHRSLLVCDRMYVELTGENRQDVLEKMQTKEQKKIMKAMRKYPSVLRTEYVYTLLAEKNPEKAEKIRGQFERSARTYPYPGEICAEEELMRIAEGTEP